MRQRQDQAECSSDRSVERTQRPRDWQILQPCHVPFSRHRQMGAGDRRNAAGHLWHGGQKVSPTWIGSLTCTSAGIKTYTPFSVKSVPETVICAILPCYGAAERGFVCPDCLELIEMETSSDGTRYMVPSDQFSSRRSIWRTTYVLIAAHRFGRRSMTGVKCRG